MEQLNAGGCCVTFISQSRYSSCHCMTTTHWCVFIIFVKTEAKMNNVEDQGRLEHTVSVQAQIFFTLMNNRGRVVLLFMFLGFFIRKGDRN